MSLTPAERTLRARAAALVMHSRGLTNTAAATAAQLGRFEREVDPDGILPPDERAKRAAQARRAAMSKLSLKASQARRRKQSASTAVGGGRLVPASTTVPGSVR
jgi:hypothetical protein